MPAVAGPSAEGRRVPITTAAAVTTTEAFFASDVGQVIAATGIAERLRYGVAPHRDTWGSSGSPALRSTTAAASDCPRRMAAWRTHRQPSGTLLSQP